MRRPGLYFNALFALACATAERYGFFLQESCVPEAFTDVTDAAIHATRAPSADVKGCIFHGTCAACCNGSAPLRAASPNGAGDAATPSTLFLRPLDHLHAVHRLGASAHQHCAASVVEKSAAQEFIGVVPESVVPITADFHTIAEQNEWHNVTPHASNDQLCHHDGMWLGRTSSVSGGAEDAYEDVYRQLYGDTMLWLLRVYGQLYSEICIAFGSDQRECVGLSFYVLWWFTTSIQPWIALSAMHVSAMAYALKLPLLAWCVTVDATVDMLANTIMFVAWSIIATTWHAATFSTAVVAMVVSQCAWVVSSCASVALRVTRASAALVGSSCYTVNCCAFHIAEHTLAARNYFCRRELEVARRALHGPRRAKAKARPYTLITTMLSPSPIHAFAGISFSMRVSSALPRCIYAASFLKY